MPLGLTNAPKSFMKMMNNFFCDCLDVFMIIIIDDILVYLEDQKMHVDHLRRVIRKFVKGFKSLDLQ